jgi:MoaA/NifB/PqqE/SkfB family radical SAM enzyme
VEQFGLGTSSNYDAGEASAKIAEITGPDNRTRLLANAHKLAPSFLMPDAGAWIWRSLAAKRAEPTPFDQLYANALVPAKPDEVEPLSFAHKLAAIIPQLSDHELIDSYLPPDEPRQKSDLRGALRFLHSALQSFGSLPVKLLAAERLSLLVPNFRPILVLWAELLEEAGDLKEAAAKARQSLSLFYDDVYTQTLFMRCAGEVNHHANGQDLFCSRPFRNFEVYEDGSVHVCNCTCVPFPVGNAITQTAEEIWQSPAAKAVRASILDGSFRYCSPMTCPWRFALPKRSERPEEFAHLQRIGIEGTVQKPQHLNLSYDRSCNLSCPSCRNQLLMANKDQRDKNDRIRDRVVLPLLETAETVYITGSGDAFGSPHFRGILKQLCDPHYKVEIILGTNGQLITPRLWEEFAPLHARFRDITISIDGATPETFERLRRGSTWEKLQVTMGILRVARETRRIRRLKVNMVVQTENFLEMRPLLALCREWAVDAVCFYRLRQWGNIIPGHYLASDITNPLHPRHRELLTELAHPDFGAPIVDHYDMYELIAKAQSGRKAAGEVLLLAAGAPVTAPESLLV